MNVVEEFCQLCRAESDLVARLIALLEQEQKVLVQGFDVQLDALAEGKSAVLDQLAVSAAQRGELMRRIGVQDSETVYIWLADKPEASLCLDRAGRGDSAGAEHQSAQRQLHRPALVVGGGRAEHLARRRSLNHGLR
ncbi:flagellar protein FlgN [Chromobacterium haemolyticum]|nr:flagellar protein FlgN [Chromobacterium haemolyticum]